MKLVVAFTSPKRSAKVLAMASKQALALNAELVLLRIMPDPEKVGVVAQLLASDRPNTKANKLVDRVVADLKTKGINATGEIRTGEVAKDLLNVSRELKADLIFLGTIDPKKRKLFQNLNPIVSYLINTSEIPLCIVPGEEYDPSDTDVDISDETLSETETETDTIES